MTSSLLEENSLGWSLKLRVHWTRKGCSLWVSDLSRTSGFQTLVYVENFFRADRLWANAVIAEARSEVGGLLLVPTSKLVD